MRYVVVLALIATACAHSLPNYPYASEPDPRDKEVTLGVGDVVAINVWGESNEALNTEATIRPDGTITMPLVGDLHAVGKTPTTLKEAIKTKLAEFVRMQGTEVTVALKAWKSYRFTVQGEVQKTGIFTTDQYVTVADALALAGGPTRFAKRGDIVLIRSNPVSKETRRIPLDYDTLASGKHLEMNIYVLPGDTIYVP
ncbi:MAG TPA: polysaccharide biosynthesis/export family protein [Kofleriaceae bacterium]|jgi:polysaccharide export outer membrane protein|nr:polysaccharide biosynthesis/export family protein [Kofleriaceae bacterium]